MTHYKQLVPETCQLVPETRTSVINSLQIEESAVAKTPMIWAKSTDLDIF